ncbi:MAG: UDP-N-acetylmuramoyl-L-alanine--D-glutamate ligase [Gordonia sp. (in: high G+C Gram-positive bacteria)]
MNLDADALDLTGARVVVTGAGTTGTSVLAALDALGATVTLVDQRFASGAPVGAPAGVATAGPDDVDLSAVDLVVTSPGFRPDNPLLVTAAAAGVPVWGDVELAWRADASELFGPSRTWLVITGTNGKTTTTSMTEAIVEAAGLATAACGNIGLPVVDALRVEPRADVLCVELSSFQLHWAPSVRPRAGVVLNIADDHLDWHGSFEAYTAAKRQGLAGEIGVVGADDAVAGELQAGPEARRVGFTLAEPEGGQLGVLGDLESGILADRAFGDDGRPAYADAPAVELIEAARVRPAGPSGVSDALAAAALTRAIGVPADAVRRGLAGFSPAAHRGQVVAEIDGVRFVDDSKATNPHAAQAAIDGCRRPVLIAGGLLKGAPVDELISRSAERLAGVVAIGADRGVILEAIARHAPQVPTVTVFTGDDGAVNTQSADRTDKHDVPAGLGSADAVMARAVSAAWELARTASRRAGEQVDAVLLAPAAASLDMFANYGARGDSFAAAAANLSGDPAIG